MLSAASLNAILAKVGETALAVVRATFVMPAVAVRSSGSTTAIVYDCLVGTSICEMLMRSRNNAMAGHAPGANGSSRGSPFDGRSVHRIVVRNPDTFVS